MGDVYTPPFMITCFKTLLRLARTKRIQEQRDYGVSIENVWSAVKNKVENLRAGFLLL